MRVSVNVEPSCNLCGLCVELCPACVFRIENGRLVREEGKCIYCRGCELLCPQKAIRIRADLTTLRYRQVVTAIS
ncbi:MAG: 4Fe-4S binding protein [Zestosphaera sp.]